MTLHFCLSLCDLFLSACGCDLCVWLGNEFIEVGLGIGRERERERGGNLMVIVGCALEVFDKKIKQ